MSFLTLKIVNDNEKYFELLKTFPVAASHPWLNIPATISQLILHYPRSLIFTIFVVLSLCTVMTDIFTISNFDCALMMNTQLFLFFLYTSVAVLFSHVDVIKIIQKCQIYFLLMTM